MSGYISKIVSRALGKGDASSYLENLSLPGPKFSNRLSSPVYPIESRPEISPQEESFPSEKQAQPVSKRTFIHTDILDYEDNTSQPKSIAEKKIEPKREDSIDTSLENEKQLEGEKSLTDPEPPSPDIQHIAPDIPKKSYRIEARYGPKENPDSEKSTFLREKQAKLENQRNLNPPLFIKRSTTPAEYFLKTSPIPEFKSTPEGSTQNFSGKKSRIFITRSDPLNELQYRAKGPRASTGNSNKLVIGKISVEIVPPAGPQVKTKPRPTKRMHAPKTKPTSTPRFNLRFGLGQI